MRAPSTLLGLCLVSPSSALAQAAHDTLPEHVVANAYAAFNRGDAVAFTALFAPRHDQATVHPDSLCSSRRTTREEELERLTKAFGEGGVYQRTEEVPARQFVAGPFVVVEEVVRGPERGVVHLYIFEVRHGQIVRTLAFDAYGRAPPLSR
ncbi:MAG TPA: hypothetical protein VFT84_12170 [Gemmatimonadales bacterium]|nr:hypothetical protein [Gemmatimonadales bacterium]